MLRWLLPAFIPALVLLAGIYVVDKRREPPALVLATFALGALGKAATVVVEGWAEQATGLTIRTSQSIGLSAALLFLFGFVAPVGELSKVMAAWPAYRSKYFDEPFDGVVYASASALGFAAFETASVLYRHPSGWVWIARTLVAQPAHVFFACAWGYALGRSKQRKRPGLLFPVAWTVATFAHGLYIHLVFARGAGALLATLPLLFTMAILTAAGARDLIARGDRIEALGDRPTTLLERVSVLGSSAGPGISSMRAVLQRGNQPIAIRWVLFGTLVTGGAMILGFAAAVAFGHMAHVDFAIVDERDVSTAAPVALLGAGLLAAFPVSGYLIAKASSVPRLLEPALSAAVALLVVFALLGLTAPVALVFALAFSPIAWGLACAGAWIGRTHDS